MNRKAGFFLLLSLAIAGAAVPVAAQSNGGGAASTTIWDGVYTDAQAMRGEKAVQQNCGACHSPAEWSNAMFIASWSGRSIGELRNQIRTTMPFDSPGRLSPAQYADIVAYILHLNDVPPGERELPSEDEALSAIAVTAKAGR